MGATVRGSRKGKVHHTPIILPFAPHISSYIDPHPLFIVTMLARALRLTHSIPSPWFTHRCALSYTPLPSKHSLSTTQYRYSPRILHKCLPAIERSIRRSPHVRLRGLLRDAERQRHVGPRQLYRRGHRSSDSVSSQREHRRQDGKDESSRVHARVRRLGQRESGRARRRLGRRQERSARASCAPTSPTIYLPRADDL